MTETEKALDELANLIAGGGLEGFSPFRKEIRSSAVFIRFTGTGSQRVVTWVPPQPVSIRKVVIFNVHNSLVIARAPYTSNDINTLPDGAEMGDVILWWSNVATPNNASMSEIDNLNFNVHPELGHKIYVTSITSNSGFVMLFYDMLRQ